MERSYDSYKRIYAKTGELFVLSTEAAAILGNTDAANQEALREFGRQVGITHQIVDAVLDFRHADSDRQAGRQ